MKKLLSLFLVLALAFSLCVGVLADETTAAEPSDETAGELAGQIVSPVSYTHLLRVRVLRGRVLRRARDAEARVAHEDIYPPLAPLDFCDCGLYARLIRHVRRQVLHTGRRRLLPA